MKKREEEKGKVTLFNSYSSCKNRGKKNPILNPKFIFYPCILQPTMLVKMLLKNTFFVPSCVYIYMYVYV